MKKRICSIVLLITLCILGACGKKEQVSDVGTSVTSIHAEYPSYDSAQELVDEANLIFSGTVESVSYEMLDVRTEQGADSMTGLTQSTDIPYTIYEIKVDTIYKGNADDETISIKCPGGELDGKQYIVEGATVIQQGEHYLFLTKTYENNYPSLLNATQATYDMNAPEALNEENEITLSQVLEILQ